MTTDLTDPTSAPSPLATRLAVVAARRRHLDGQVASLQSFEQRLTQKVRAAPHRPRPTRAGSGAHVRLLGVRARLQESLAAQGRAVADEERLRDQVGDEDERLEQTRRETTERLERAQREADERREFELACLRAVAPARP